MQAKQDEDEDAGEEGSDSEGSEDGGERSPGAKRHKSSHGWMMLSVRSGIRKSEKEKTAQATTADRMGG
jgi:hypothetical protein